jgi:hypothetical protein
MHPHHIAALIGGFAIGAFLGYELSGTLVGYPPYSYLANYIMG